ncbi:iron complex outermembrane receptor protein [Novosphingobium hassiacum]|uniref:Iron complex outermembrane receptor protein n=1 Tax=Novosphingobium hassiacum TaxID=173676 RepID=A0A7W5ZY70_9SPHN|nr:TonB-dependent receptor plug domain-containing protein [Novosphingobium hassiacum]MBB3862161.1 iron complex outermembrane receptor protein [Novosphingobium hassiacum]
MIRVSRLLATCAAVAVSASIFSTSGLAQAAAQAGAEGVDDAPVSGDIVVTARRRAEDIARVPTTVAALGADAIAERSIATQSDLQAAVPGLIVRETQSNNQLNYSIRGQTVDAFSGSSTAVVPYVNEVPFVAGGVASFFDLQSIQVVKGPQGTLFGRNATGGAVLSMTAKPTNDHSGNLRLGYGNYNAINAEGAFNIPWIEDKVLFRAAFKIARRDGYIENVYRGPVFNDNNNRELGKVDSTALRGTLLLRPSETIENTLMVQYEATRGNNSGTRLFSFNTCGTKGPDGSPLVCNAHFLFGPQLDANIGFPGAWAAVLAANPGYDPAGIQGVLARQNNQLGFWQVNDAMPSFHRGEDWAVTNTTTVDVSDTLKVKNIFGYSSARAIDSTGQSGTPYLLISNFDINRPAGGALRNFGNEVSNSSVSDELQLQGTAFDDGLDYILGGYFQEIRNRTIFPQSYFSLSPVIPPASTTSHFTTVDRTYAAFAHATVDLGKFGLLDGLKFSFGGRYAWEKISLNHERGGTYFGLTTPDAKFDRASWNVGLEYQANSDVMLYVVARESWRAGGINGVAPPALSATLTNTDKFLPEVAQDFEAGVKYSGMLGGLRSHVYLSAYTMRVKNVQRALFPANPVNPALGSIAVTVNVPEARIKGLEADIGVKLADWLELGVNGAHTDAEFTKNVARPFGVPTLFGPVADVPRWSGSAYATVTVPITETADVKLRGDVYSQSNFYFSNTALSLTPHTKLPGYTIANFRLDIDGLLGEGFGLGFWIRNAFNEKYYVGGLAQGGSLGSNSANVGRPRMYGAEIRAKF